MTALSHYQSVIQLGAALNFGYAALEAVTDQPLVLLSATRSHLEKHAVNLGGVGRLTNRQLIALDMSRRIVEKVGSAKRWLILTNPYVSAIFGFICICFLIRASQEDCCVALTSGQTALLFGTCYGWFTMIFAAQLTVRIWIEVASSHIAKAAE